MTADSAGPVAFRQKGFTIIELMVVIAIVSILAVIAIPSYQEYAVRSKMTEVIARGAESKTSVTEWYSSWGRLPSVAASAPFNTGPAGKVRSALWDPTNQRVELTVSSTGTDPLIAGTSIYIEVTSTASGVVSWQCQPGTIPQKYLPSSCK